jgi:predicted naringenin-chalcone synthase
MYQIVRNHVVEDLELEDNGKKLVLHVDMNVDKILGRYLQVAGELAQAQRAVRAEQTDEKVEALGAAILNVFSVIFGDAQAKQLVDFYDGAYMEMLADVTPFINDVVAPKVNEAQQRIMQQYKNVKRFQR